MPVDARPLGGARFSASFIQPELIGSMDDAALAAHCDRLAEAGIGVSVVQSTVDPMQTGRMLALRPCVVGLQSSSEWWQRYARDTTWLDEQAQDAIELARTLWAAWGRMPTFAGWYLPLELDNVNHPTAAEWGAFVDHYLRPVVSELRTLAPHLPVSTAPFFVSRGETMGVIGWRQMWTFILSRVPLDVVALQDGIGAGNTTRADLPVWFGALRDAIAHAGVQTRLIGDVETFMVAPSGNVAMPTAEYVASMQALLPLTSGLWAFSYDHYQASDPRAHAAYLAHVAGVAPTLSDDLTTELGRALTDVEQRQAALWERDILADITARFGDAMPAPALVDRVVRLALVARFRAPRAGLSQTQISVDEATVVHRYDQSTAGALITPDLWAMLGWVEPSDIRTVRPYVEPDPYMPRDAWWPR